MARSRPTRFALLGLGAAAVLGGSSVVFLLPAGDAPRAADVIVVIAGPGPRIERGEDLVRAGFATEMVLMTPTPENCVPDVPVRQHCRNPVPATTRGEARATAALADERGWTSVLLVVQNEQALRAEMRFRRCLDAGVSVRTVTVRDGVAGSLERALYESGATAKALTTERGC
jgi:hypothetical protein